jgi:hypothetical protein
MAIIPTSMQRLQGVMQKHSERRWSGTAAGVMYIRRDEHTSERVERVGKRVGFTRHSGRFRIERLETVRCQAAEVSETMRADRYDHA